MAAAYSKDLRERVVEAVEVEGLSCNQAAARLRFIPREGLRDLAGDPFRRGGGRYTQRYQPPSFVPEDDQDEQQLETDRRHDQEVHRADACGMVVQKALPGLRPSSPALRHILGDC